MYPVKITRRLYSFISLSLLSWAIIGLFPNLTLRSVAAEPIRPDWVEVFEEWASPFEFERQPVGNTIDENDELNREDLIISMERFFDGLIQAEGFVTSKLQDDVDGHTESTLSTLSDEVTRLQAEADRLIANNSDNKVSSHRLKASSKAISEEQIPKELAETNRVGDQVTANELPDDIDISSPYAEAVWVLGQLGVEVTFEDGTFRPEEPLTQSQYISILQQVDAAFAGEYEVDSLLMGFPDYPNLPNEKLEVTDAALDELLKSIETVRMLALELQEQERSSAKKQTAYTARLSIRKNVEPSNPEVKAPVYQTATSIQDVSDVSPTDAVYESLDRLVNEWGVDVIVRTDGSFEPDVTITRGEAALYLGQMAYTYFNIPAPQDETDFILRVYSHLTAQMQETEQDLRNALAASR